MIFMKLLAFRRNANRQPRLVCTAVLALAMIAVGDAGAQSAVQGVPNAMQGFSQNRDQPIQIEAATLEMRDKKKEATFSGNVKVVQGDTTMTSKTLVVFYDHGQSAARPAGANTKAAAKSAPIQSATPGPGGSSSIRRLEAQGNVVVTQKDQVVTGETAVFDTKTNLDHHARRRGADPGQERAARRSADGGHDHRACRGWNPTADACRACSNLPARAAPAMPRYGAGSLARQ